MPYKFGAWQQVLYLDGNNIAQMLTRSICSLSRLSAS
jgi:hypothetical protein